MIVRTYQRRNRNIGRTLSDCEEESSSQEYLGGFSLGSSSQDSTSWEPKQKAKPSIGLCTSTLMETQESGEMMEYVDEANFALDGLKPGQPLRIQRASLVSLLSIFSTAQQRRLLRTQGMAKPVIDAIVALSTDDPPTALAASALFYVLASDGQDEHLLDSADCIKFLLKLLLPSLPEASEKKATLGSKILGVTTNSSLLKVSSSGSDRGGVSIISKVRKLVSNMKEIQTRSSGEDRDGDNFSGQELNSKWLALLTLEKACLSTVALEDTSGAVRRVGGHFKERLRELGGLDAVCDVVLNCFAILKEALEDQGSNVVRKSSMTTKMNESVGMLLKCMKVMENATFLSEQNQKHLLEMILKLRREGSELSFIALVINVIKTLSGLLLRHKSHSSVSGRHEKHSMTGNDGNNIHSSKSCTGKPELPISATVTTLEEELKGGMEAPSLACTSNGGRGRRKTVKLSTPQDKVVNSTIFKNKSVSTLISTSEFSVADSNNDHALSGETCYSKDRLTGSNAGKTTQAKNTVNRVSAGMKSLVGLGKQSSRSIDQKRSACFEDSQDPYESACFEDSQDPYEFNDEELAPMKGKKLKKTKKLKAVSVSANNTNAGLDSEDVPQFSDGTMGLINGQEQYDDENELTKRQWAEAGTLLGDCLLSAVKVLMNLTNDNPIGCHQVAVCGGLDTMASLIVDHYPLFQCHLLSSSKRTGKDTSTESPANGSCDEALSDQDLDLLVVILGVLVNLVEKDTGNRARLAASSVTLPRSTGGSSEVRGCRRGVIALLCSIFLTRQGAGEAIHGAGMVATEANDEAAIMQSQREAENMIVEAYAALLLGFLSKESENARQSIALCLPDHNLKVLVPILERFVAFHLSLNMISSETHAAVAEVIESCKQPF